MSTYQDVIVIGGGPAGSTAATLIAREGYSVLQLEREPGPTFKVGESLIPASNTVLKRLGLIDRLQQSEFPKKHSVQFFSSSGRASAPFYFSETEDSEHSQTWQVLRSQFDAMLREHGQESGVEIRSGVTVQEVLFEGERAVGVKIRNEEGQIQELRSKIVVDSSGQRAILARQLKIRRPDPQLRMAAVYTHFENAVRDEGIDEGATLVLRTGAHRCWFWFIPLPNNRVSVGVVGPVDHLITGRQGNPQRIFDEELASCPGLQPRLENATQLFDAKVVNDFSYAATQVAGDGWVLAGDAFCFLDPVYSSGMALAFASGELAADSIVESLRHNDPSEERLRAHEPYLQKGIAAFRHLVYAFYSPEFHFGRFLGAHPEHRDSIVKILVGDVFNRDFSTLFRDLDNILAIDYSHAPPLVSGGVPAEEQAGSEVAQAA